MSSNVLVRANDTEPSLVLFGRDPAGKPRASWFDAASAELAIKAAELMRMKIMRVVTEQQRAVAKQLARGRVFATGRAFTPFARTKVYKELVALASEGTAPAAVEKLVALTGSQDGTAAASEANGATAAPDGGETGPGGGPSAPERPENLDEVGIGSVVLAPDRPTLGWFEATVIGINGLSLTLRWRDYPTDPTFVRRRDQIALLPANAA
jgi:hypothetical protein